MTPEIPGAADALVESLDDFVETFFRFHSLLIRLIRTYSEMERLPARTRASPTEAKA
jgi:hypothetical protein